MPAPPSSRSARFALVAICVAYFMVVLDTTVTNVALPAIGRDLDVEISGLQWVAASYALTFASLLLTGGALSDRAGAKRAFGGGTLLFTVASAACSLAPSLPALAVARAAQGAGAALAVPASLAVLQEVFTESGARARALGVWGGVAGIGAGAGPVVGGLLVTAVGWRSVFLVNVPIGLAGVALAVRVLPASPRRRHPIDPGGLVTSVVALASLTLALIEGGPLGWRSPLVLGGFALFVLAGLAFCAVEARAGAALLPLRALTERAFAGGAAVGLLINLGFYGELLLLSLYLQQIGRLTALQAGLALLPQMAMAVAGSTLSGRVLAHTGPRLPVLVGLAVGALGLLALAAATGRPPSLLLGLPMVATGFGMSFTMPAVTAAVMRAAPDEQGGRAAAVVNASRQVGGLVGVALLPAFLGRGAAFLPGLQVAIAIAAAAFVVALGVAAVTMRRAATAPPRSRRGDDAASGYGSPSDRVRKTGQPTSVRCCRSSGLSV